MSRSTFVRLGASLTANLPASPRELSSILLPGPNIFASTIPVVIAIAVVSVYITRARPPTRPSALISPSEHTPEIKEKVEIFIDWDEDNFKTSMSNSDILLAAKMRAPEWGKNVLEDWLMSLRGEQLRPKDKNQRVASIKRIKEIVNRNLHSASLEGIKDDLHLINLRINSAEIGLNPFESTLQEAE